MSRELKVYDVRCRKGDSAFLLDDGVTSILYDTGFGFTGYAVADNIRAVLRERPLDYIFLTHSHYDHALGSACIRKVYPGVKTVAGRYAAQVFARPGARRVMEELDRKFARTCGIESYDYPWDALTVDIPCDDGDIIEAGDMRFQVIDLPGHTKCSVGYYCAERGLLLGTETLGVYDGAGVVVPSYLVGYRMSLQSMERVRALPVRKLLLPHYGMVEGAQMRQYLDNMIPAAEKTAADIRGALQAGLSEREIIDRFRDTFWHGYIREIYPIDAAELNTSITIKLIRKELCE